MPLQISTMFLVVLITETGFQGLCNADALANRRLTSLKSSEEIRLGGERTSSDLLVGTSNKGIENAPYHVSVRGNRRHEHYGFLCCGTIFTDRHVLVVSPCVANPADDANVYIAAGTPKIFPENNDPMVTAYVMGIYRFHRDDKMQYDARDIAVLKLGKRLPIAENIRPVTLSSSMKDLQGCVVSGWGQTRNSVLEVPKPPSEIIMRTVHIRASPAERKVCQAAFPALRSDEICSGGSTCTYDEGAPLVCKGLLFGLLIQREDNFDKRCLAEGNVDVFVNITSRFNDLKVFLEDSGAMPTHSTPPGSGQGDAFTKATFWTMLIAMLTVLAGGHFRFVH